MAFLDRMKQLLDPSMSRVSIRWAGREEPMTDSCSDRWAISAAAGRGHGGYPGQDGARDGPEQCECKHSLGSSYADYVAVHDSSYDELGKPMAHEKAIRNANRDNDVPHLFLLSEQSNAKSFPLQSQDWADVHDRDPAR